MCMAILYLLASLSLIHSYRTYGLHYYWWLFCWDTCGPGQLVFHPKKFPMGGTAMFALLAMAAGRFRQYGILLCVCRYRGPGPRVLEITIRVWYGVGLIFPCILLVMLFILYIADKKQIVILERELLITDKDAAPNSLRIKQGRQVFRL